MKRGQEQYRLPDGTYVNSFTEYCKFWQAKGKVIEDLSGGKLHMYGFDPDISFISADNRSVQLPLWFINLLEKKEK